MLSSFASPQIAIQIPFEFLQRLAILGAILIATWVVARILGSFISETAGRFSPNIAREVRRFVTWLTWLIGILIGLDQLGLELTLLLMIVGLGGILLLIALRDILSNVASREAIITQNPFKIGDWIEVGKCFGRVVDITWMYTIVVTPDNETVHIPNSKIIRNVIINKTTPGGIRISVPITVDRTSDLSVVERTLLEIGAELSEELAPDSKPEVRVVNTNSHSIKLELLLKINNPAKGRFIASEIRKKAKQKLNGSWHKISP